MGADGKEMFFQRDSHILSGTVYTWQWKLERLNCCQLEWFGSLLTTSEQLSKWMLRHRVDIRAAIAQSVGTWLGDLKVGGSSPTRTKKSMMWTGSWRMLVHILGFRQGALACWARERQKQNVSAVSYPIKNVEIVNTVLSPIYPVYEWGICLFFPRVVCAPQQKSRSQPVPPSILV